MDLFASQGLKTEGTPVVTDRSPLAVRMRPQTPQEVVGQQHLLQSGAPLHRLLHPQAGTKSVGNSVILWGPPGTGKTTLAYLVAHSSGCEFVEISAVSDGVKQVRAVISRAKDLLVTNGKQTVLFVDEVHRFSKSQQDALLPAVENRWVILIAATTENPAFSVVSPLLSRSLLLTLQPLTVQDVKTLLERALVDERGFAGQLTAGSEVISTLAQLAGPDARRALTLLEAAGEKALLREAETGSFGEKSEPAQINLEDVHTSADTAIVRYDKDDHYDVISAFIKSMRGSDVDAALHYLARMIEAGEDPRFIARRVMICAAEDVGLANPQVLPLTVAAAQATQLIGMPEARIILAEAVVAVACSPKSNRSYQAINQALADVQAGKGSAVPAHLRDTHYAAAEQMGAKGYKYAHDYPHAIVQQTYLPADLVGTTYYQPTDHGAERGVKENLERIRQRLGQETLDESQS